MFKIICESLSNYLTHVDRSYTLAQSLITSITRVHTKLRNESDLPKNLSIETYNKQQWTLHDGRFVLYIWKLGAFRILLIPFVTVENVSPSEDTKFNKIEVLNGFGSVTNESMKENYHGVVDDGAKEGGVGRNDTVESKIQRDTVLKRHYSGSPYMMDSPG